MTTAEQAANAEARRKAARREHATFLRALADWELAAQAMWLLRRYEEAVDAIEAGRLDDRSASWIWHDITGERVLVQAEIARRTSFREQGDDYWHVFVRFAQDLKARVDLALFLGERYPSNGWRRSGDHVVGWCPFHVERQSPSMHVWSDSAHCFGCQWHGDVFDVVRDAANEERWAKCVMAVAKHAGVAVPQPKRETTRAGIVAL